jgi:hypothetical protein
MATLEKKDHDLIMTRRTHMKNYSSNTNAFAKNGEAGFTKKINLTRNDSLKQSVVLSQSNRGGSYSGNNAFDHIQSANPKIQSGSTLNSHPRTQMQTMTGSGPQHFGQNMIKIEENSGGLTRDFLGTKKYSAGGVSTARGGSLKTSIHSNANNNHHVHQSQTQLNKENREFKLTKASTYGNLKLNGANLGQNFPSKKTTHENSSDLELEKRNT